MRTHKVVIKKITSDSSTKYTRTFQRISWVYDKNDHKILFISLSFPPITLS